jgi:TRAP-type C4-dicarboxylate transport system permease small subunit
MKTPSAANILGRLDALAIYVGYAAVMAMMAHVCADVVGRTFFKAPVYGTAEIVSAYYMVIVAVLPWASLVRGEGHIIVELFTQKVSSRNLRWIDAFANALTAAFMTVLAWRSFHSALSATETGEVWESAVGHIPVWPARWLLPLSSVLMLAAVVVKTCAANSGPSMREGQA